MSESLVRAAGVGNMVDPGSALGSLRLGREVSPELEPGQVPGLRPPGSRSGPHEDKGRTRSCFPHALPTSPGPHETSPVARVEDQRRTGMVLPAKFCPWIVHLIDDR